MLFRSGIAEGVGPDVVLVLGIQRQLGIAARASYEARFTGEMFAANLERVYSEILKNKGGSPR